MMGAMTDDPARLHAVMSTGVMSTGATAAPAEWVAYERTDRLACLREAVAIAARHEVWDARDIVVWAEYLRTGVVLDYTPSVVDQAARSAPPGEVWGGSVAVRADAPVSTD